MPPDKSQVPARPQPAGNQSARAPSEPQEDAHLSAPASQQPPSAGSPPTGYDTQQTSTRLKDIIREERPQERFEKLGPKALSDTELLALLLRSGSKTIDVMGVANNLLREAGSLSELLKWSQEDFCRFTGVGRVKALKLLTCMEISRRVLMQNADAQPAITDSEKAYEIMLPRCMGLEVEKFWALCLNQKHRLIKIHECTSGTASSSLVHAREVFREAIRTASSAVICVHNHPSGDTNPSTADIQITRKLREASKTIDIRLLDHLIVGIPNENTPFAYYSFAESGML